MREIRGALVFDTLEELLSPKHTALLVIDVQNYGSSLDGPTAQSGVDISHKRVAIPFMQQLLRAARRSGMLVVFTKIVESAESLHPAWLHRVHGIAVIGSSKGQAEALRRTALEGTPEADVVPELTPQRGEIEIAKYRSSAFLKTGLDEALRARSIRSVVIAGVSTESCVLATAIDAQGHDYYTIVVRDAVGSLKPERASLATQLMDEWFTMLDTNEVVATWNQAAT